VRSPDFFRLLEYQSDRCTVLVDEGADGAIRGVATLTHRQAYVGGRAVEAAYLGDFRISFNREAMRIWRSFYPALLEACAAPTITCVIDQNTRAQNALIRQDKAGFRYEELTPYTMVNVLGRAPWRLARRGHDGRKARPEDLPAIEAFLDRQERTRAFGFCYGEGELKRRLETWDAFDASNFFLLEREGKIRACFALWSPSQAKVNVIERIPWYYQLYRPLAPVPRSGEVLRVMYLTHVGIDRELPAAERRECFGALFDHMAIHAWDPAWHMVSFCDFPSSDFQNALRGRYLLQTIPMKLFTVRPSNSQPLDLEQESRAEPGFEMALV
jgi:hypothetical protein